MPASALIWAPLMTMDNHAVTADASIRNFDVGTAACVASALEQALLLPEVMHELRMMRDQNVFMTLKKELALVRILPNYHSFILNILIIIVLCFDIVKFTHYALCLSRYILYVCFTNFRINLVLSCVSLTLK